MRKGEFREREKSEEVRGGRGLAGTWKLEPSLLPCVRIRGFNAFSLKK